jgi:peptidoglycan hydrolase-like protein with peptidoglycan-binding domain
MAANHETAAPPGAFQHTQVLVRNMKPFAILAAGSLLTAALSSFAVGQTIPPLAYVQPVPPGAVQVVQEHLRHAGAYNGAVDGVWGPDSVVALQQFQSSHQLQVTGQLNQATVSSLGLDPQTLLGSQQAAVPPLPPADTLRPSSVRALQERLRSLGFYTGGVDGIWGQSTQNAVSQFQQNRGLQPTGQLTPATVTSMGLAPNALVYR